MDFNKVLNELEVELPTKIKNKLDALTGAGNSPWATGAMDTEYTAVVDALKKVYTDAINYATNSVSNP